MKQDKFNQIVELIEDVGSRASAQGGALVVGFAMPVDGYPGTLNMVHLSGKDPKVSELVDNLYLELKEEKTDDTEGDSILYPEREHVGTNGEEDPCGDPDKDLIGAYGPFPLIGRAAI